MSKLALIGANPELNPNNPFPATHSRKRLREGALIWEPLYHELKPSWVREMTVFLRAKESSPPKRLLNDLGGKLIGYTTTPHFIKGREFQRRIFYLRTSDFPLGNAYGPEGGPAEAVDPAKVSQMERWEKRDEERLVARISEDLEG